MHVLTATYVIRTLQLDVSAVFITLQSDIDFSLVICAQALHAALGISLVQQTHSLFISLCAALHRPDCCQTVYAWRRPLHCERW